MSDNVTPLPTRRRKRSPLLIPVAILDTDVANGRRLARRHGRDMRYTVERGFMIWDGRRWVADPKQVRIAALAKDTAGAMFDELKDSPPEQRDALYRNARDCQSRPKLEAMIWCARSEPGIPAMLKDFDADGWLLNVSNGTIDLRTQELRAHRREDLIAHVVEIRYDPKANCELWVKFLARVTAENEELQGYLRRLVGYLLTGETTEQVLHFLFGLGANGKSVFCEIIESLLGDYAIVVSPEMVMQRRHSGIPNDIARLRGVRAALMNETSQGSRFDEAKLKDLTGGDSLTGRFLHAEFFDFSPTHKLVIRGNHKPAIDGRDEGIWRRLRLVPFTITIPLEERDQGLLLKLRTELPGILNWALQGCREWQAEGLKPPAIIVEAVRQYREESDTLCRFIADCCEVRKLAQVKSSALFKHYQQYAEQAGERWIPAKDFPAAIQQCGYEWKRTKVGGMFFGLELSGADAPLWEER